MILYTSGIILILYSIWTFAYLLFGQSARLKVIHNFSQSALKNFNVLFLLRKRIRQKRFIRQFLPALGQISNIVKAGCSLEEAFKTIASENPAPLAEEFSMLIAELKIYNDFEGCLKKFALRIPLPEVIIFTNSLIISRRSGANIVEQIRNIEKTLRDRFYIEDKVRSLTVQGKIQALVSALLPLFIVFFVRLIDPEYFQPLFRTGTGSAILICATVMNLSGLLLALKLSRVKF